MSAQLQSRDDLVQKSDARRFELRRDGMPNLIFNGWELAAVEAFHVERKVMTRLAVYRTCGGKYISQFLRQPVDGVDRTTIPVDVRFVRKVTVFERFEDAVGSFWPGRATTELKAQLGVLDGEFID